MSAQITGLDLAEALASLPEQCDRDFARELFVIAEGSFMASMLERLDQEKTGKEEDGESNG